MKAIIVPGVTDMNKGDQALVWESHRLATDTGCFSKVYIVSSGDTKEEREKLCSQSEAKGYEFVENILKHPRRGKHHDTDIVKESMSSFLTLAIHAASDFLNRSFLLLICNNKKLVNFFYNKQVSKTISQFQESDVIFVKGGGFIHAYGEKTAPYLMWFFLFYVRLALAMKKKVIFLPNSFGPFEGLTVKSQVKSVFKKLDRVYAREALSAQKLGQLLDTEIKVSPDLGFYLKMSDNQKGLAVLNKYGLTENDKIVGITIRPWRFPGKNNPEALYENYIAAVTELTKHLLDNGFKVALCNQSIGPNSHEDDRNAISELTSRIAHPNLIWINENLPCDVLKALYSNFYAFVGTRFHSVIFSLTSLVPSLAIGYGGNKAKGIMSDFKLEEFTIQIEDSNAPQLISMFEKLVLDYDNIKLTLASNIKVFDQKREDILKDIVTAIR